MAPMTVMPKVKPIPMPIPSMKESITAFLEA